MTGAILTSNKSLHQIDKSLKLDIEFEDLRYSVRDSSVKSGEFQILNAVSGKFRCGELTAILGPSGAGKTTLLNILAGYETRGVKGDIKINSHPRDLKVFNKLSTLIMQECIVQPRLTVEEAMIYATDLKLGSRIKQQDKVAVVEEVLNFLGLERCASSFCENLSGGEKRRLSIALELVNNPPVIFLDEPTSGLDNFSVKQCVDLLKKISGLDRTVVCTIHQPPASLFQVFDQVYILAQGSCVYNGSPSQLVPFCSLAGYSCPSNNTPADYIIELVHLDPSIISNFKTKIQNGKVNVKENEDQDINLEIVKEEQVYRRVMHATENSDMDFATSYQDQLFILLSRTLLQTSRYRLGLSIQIVQHLVSGLFIGAIFSKISNDASEMYAMIKFCFLCVLYIIYTYIMTPVLLLPFEIQLVKREYFNRWYSVKAYYLAWTIINGLPLIILCTMFTTMVYLISGQPQDSNRFIGFCLIVLSVGLTSQGLGFLLGAILSVKKGAIVASALITALLTMGIHGMGYESTIGPFLTFLTSLSFMRNGLIGLCCVLFYKRKPLICGEDSFECPYTQGDLVLTRMSVPITDYKFHLAYLFVFMMVLRIIAYFVLKYSLNVQSTANFAYYFQKSKNRCLKSMLCFRKSSIDLSSNNT